MSEHEGNTPPGVRAYREGCRCDECREANTVLMRQYRQSKGLPGKPRRKSAHGNRSKYVAGCRCEKCSKANREYQREWMRNHRDQFGDGLSLRQPSHGKVSTYYRHHCRCEACCAAVKEKNRKYRKKRNDDNRPDSPDQ